MRSPSSGFSDSNVSPSFLRTTPAKNPRTECGCHPVVFMMAGMVAPCGWRSILRTSACLEFARGADGTPFACSAPLFAVFGALADFALWAGLLLRISCSLQVVTAHAATSAAPRRPNGAGGVKRAGEGSRLRFVHSTYR